MPSSLPTDDSLPQAAGSLNAAAEENRDDRQLELFESGSAIVHFYDRNGALHTGCLFRKISKGRNRGQFLIKTTAGRIIKPQKIRNVELK